MATATKAQVRKSGAKARAVDEKLTPPLKWAGGKRWLIPHIQAYWEKHSDRRLVEPFCGGLAVALGLSPERALLNDINGPLMNFYAWLKKGLSYARLDMRNDADAYYAHRERFNALLMSGRGRNKQAAELFYYLNRTGYNGLCRFNGKGEFNVPFGRYNRINYTKNFSAYREIFEKWEFRSQDFASLPIDPGDFIYADPPYDVQFTKYAKEDFSMGGSGASRGISKHTPRPGGALESGDGKNRPLIRRDGIYPAIPRRPAPHQLHRGSFPRAGGVGGAGN